MKGKWSRFHPISGKSTIRHDRFSKPRGEDRNAQAQGRYPQTPVYPHAVQ